MADDDGDWRYQGTVEAADGAPQRMMPRSGTGLPASGARIQSPLLVLGLVLIAAVFVLLVGVAVSTLDHAIRHAGYHYSFHNSTSSGDYFADAPTYGDAAWALGLGPGLQIVLFGVGYGLASTPRRIRPHRLAVATVWMIAVDMLYGLVIWGAAAASVI